MSDEQDWSQYAKPGPYATKLSPSEESAFKTWVAKNKVPWQDSAKSDYDMRGYWKAQVSGDKSAKTSIDPLDKKPHYPDTWKTPYHKTFSRESQYALPTAGHWEGEKFVPPDQQGVTVTGPDSKEYQFPAGTTKESAIAYFKKKGIGAAPAPKTPDQLHAERAARANVGKTGIPTAAEQREQQPGVLKNLAEGAGKSAAQGIQTVGKLVGADIGKNVDLEPRGTAQSVGAMAETAAEYLTGEEALKGLTTAMRLGQTARVAAIVRKFPRLAPIAEAGARAFGLGTAQAALHGEEHPLRSGVITGLTGAGGEALGQTLSAMKPKALAKSKSLVNRYIGLKKSDIPKWERLKVNAANDVADAVINHVGIKPTLELQRDAIESTRKSLNTLTENSLANVPARTIPIASILDAAKQSVGKEIRNQGTDYIGRLASLDAQIDDMKQLLFGQAVNPHINVSKALQIRRNLHPNFNTPALQTLPGVDDMLHAHLYGSLNEAIENSLPQSASDMFKRNNALQHKLILARDAATETMNTVSRDRGAVSKAVTLATNTALGAGAGAVVGAISGSNMGRDVAVGAAIGGLGFHGRHLRTEADLPGLDIAASKAAAKIAPAAAEVLRRSPALARAFESAVAAHGGGSGALASQK